MMPTSTPTTFSGTARITALDNARWRAMTARTLGELAPFVIAVRTTGIYCRVGCPARTPHRENVRFFDATADAQEAGFRACKRCHPDAGDLSPWRSPQRRVGQRTEQLVNAGQIRENARA